MTVFETTWTQITDFVCLSVHLRDIRSLTLKQNQLNDHEKDRMVELIIHRMEAAADADIEVYGALVLLLNILGKQARKACCE